MKAFRSETDCLAGRSEFSGPLLNSWQKSPFPVDRKLAKGWYCLSDSLSLGCTKNEVCESRYIPEF